MERLLTHQTGLEDVGRKFAKHFARIFELEIEWKDVSTMAPTEAVSGS
jgi:hypothetical protein